MLRAIQIRTGERSAVEAIDAWLLRHGVETVDCADALEACVYLLNYGQHAPDFAFIGTDWLMPEETALIEYMRAKWPRVRLVLYGQEPDVESADAPLTLLCSSPTALRQLLAHAPAQLLQHPNFAADAENPAAVESADVLAEPAPALENPPRRRSFAETREPESAVSNKRTPNRFPSPALEPQPLRTVLTSEELTALLQDTDA